jgi:hypothetical protein
MDINSIDEMEDVEHVGFDDFDDEPFQQPLTSGELTRTDKSPEGVVIYPHAYSVRFKVTLEESELLPKLAEVGVPTDWKNSILKTGKGRSQMRGSAWLTHRAPRGQKSALARLNQELKTRLYALSFEEGESCWYVDMAGVRWEDTTKLLEGVLELSKHEYSLAYYRAAERYIVLSPPEAQRLARLVNERVPPPIKGRNQRKKVLVSHELPPIKIRHRAKAYPELKVYRIEPGATCDYRVEVRLQARRSSRGEFAAKDVATLDALLLDLVREHNLQTVLKPNRWEPRTPRSRVEQGSVDRSMSKLPLKAWQGRRMEPSEIRARLKCHSPHTFFCFANERNDGAITPSPRVRTSRPPKTSSPSNETECWKLISGGLNKTSHYPWSDGVNEVNAPLPPSSSVYASMVREALAPGLLSEVILDPERSPRDLMNELVRQAGNRKLGVRAYAREEANGGPDTWHSVHEMVFQHPSGVDDEVTVFFVDTSVAGAAFPPEVLFEDAVENEPASRECEADQTHYVPSILGAVFYDMLKGIREACEALGYTAIFVTTDFRSFGAEGELKPRHFFTDARVRSLLGDAGRYWCHQRYRVEERGGRASRVIAIKDGLEGRVGRQVTGPASMPSVA